MPSAYLDVLGRLALARLDFDTGREAEGVRGLSRALRTAREKGFRHFHPWWIPSMVRELLHRALQAGIEPAYARFLVRANRLAPPRDAGPRWPYPVQVRVLGGFRIARDGRPLASGARTPTRVLDLLKALAARGPDGVAIDRVLEDLWSEAQGDAARASFDVCLHRARRLLGEPDALLLVDGRLSFNPDHVWLDLAAIESRTRALDADGVAGAAVGERDRADLAELAREWLDTYRGRVLADQPEAAWVLSARLRWDERLERRATVLAARCAEAGLAELAEAVYRRLLDADPTSERAARGLVGLLERGGRHGEARRASLEFESAMRIARRVA
jgi:DNA-binding SARP family transcriptional activator